MHSELRIDTKFYNQTICDLYFSKLYFICFLKFSYLFYDLPAFQIRIQDRVLISGFFFMNGIFK